MANPFDMVLFGGGGDLALRKLIPALYRAHREGSLAEGCRILPVCRRQEDADNYLETAQQALKTHLRDGEYNDNCWREFSELLRAVALDISVPDEQWDSLTDVLGSDSERVRIFYLAIPPAVFGPCCENLSLKGLIHENSRVVVEKPLGYNARTSDEINGKIATYFPEQNIFRIDHYLGKETVQNLLALRFSNVLFEHLWDAKTIDHIQISISETVGLEGRAGFYDETGALRDMVQNHLLQLLCLIAMESPNSMSAKNIRAEKIKVLEALRPLVGEAVDQNIVRGQYVAGGLGTQLVPGYLEELEAARSSTETFVAIRAHIDNWRWAGVPFYLRTGKRMEKRCAEIVIQYKCVSHRVYDESAGEVIPNRLVIRLQPEESIKLVLMAKKMDSLTMELQPAELNLTLSDTYDSFRSDAYKRLMLDVAENNPALFIHRDEVAAAWAWVDPIINHWRDTGNQPHLYRAGSWGPQAASELLARDGRHWFNAQ
ncbi:glucose-6-phosphate dehydrogenase [Microbulbifer thermotolerans]|uniref:Glucose-6-phosphate 1-dehydrogenase n=1 Tax=Microbulbifer thermotolerans TaxID=252514 RepID=A0A143HJV7_MICTH|nr:glucose-6-phosphate dehydrogenase [Microbulbifer thermotolerans]AMX01988.1 glucose-6-phosphate dehydrogenase [Microbulbifer thermotolerans]MCX2780554.1 glucose-6-phosphate dehydrogenase [Microbulbifer thermotolerans]MCX2783149.1 glucose-6-phosphate dehydrogenase [Microbulbifer thermotolerans]MCX2794249.1 glucose-6-phosphate dehydrogenase [Microbulbifer thermotolerans]MCX2800729.1 glucose-6-phosphate dehydrogenase [Microbulbifer thermotolerans]